MRRFLIYSLVMFLSFEINVYSKAIHFDKRKAEQQNDRIYLTVWQNGKFIQLRWNIPNNGVDGFNIYKKTSELEKYSKVNSVLVTNDNYVDTFTPTANEIFYKLNIVVKGIESDLGIVDSIFINKSDYNKNEFQLRKILAFNKNNIISDLQLLSSSAMSQAQIQTFLESYNSVLRNYYYNGKIASQLIYEACQSHGISPYVVLTTLHKEQGLIGPSTNNLQNRIDWAMGWGSRSNFGDQIYYGTRQFKRYYDNLGAYNDVNGTPWAVGLQRKVFDGYVTVENTATAGLYIYTPYIGGTSGIGGNYLFWNTFYNVFSFGNSSPSYLSAPVLSFPQNTSVNQSINPTFVWSHVNDATSYRILVATNSSALPNDPTADNFISSGGVINETTNNTSYTPSNNLNYSTTYYWEVHARSPNNYGTWSNIYSFSTISNSQTKISSVSPSPSSPATANVNQNFNLNISVGLEVASAGYLQVWVYDSDYSTSQKSGVYISSPQSTVRNLNVTFTRSQAGQRSYTIFTQFRPGATGGPLNDSQQNDVTNSIYNYQINWQAPTPILTITSPNGGETWQTGTTQTITWTSSNVTGTIQIQPYLNGIAQTNIAAAAPNTESYSWSIPANYTTGNTYKIGISAMNGTISDFSNGNFSIISSPSCYSLSKNINPSNCGAIIVNTPTNCTGGYTANTQISLTAQANNGYTFSSWSVSNGGSFSNSSSTTTTFTITGNATVTANFTQSQQQSPTVTTLATTNITQTSAQLNCTINPNGLSTVYYFMGGVQTGLISETPRQNAGSGTTNISGNYLLTGLSPNTTYNYSAAAQNSAGTTIASQVIFTTLQAGVPTVTTTIATNITSSSATSGGTVSSDGGASVTARGVCWSTSSNPTVSNSFTSDGTGTGTFTSYLTGLNAGTEYHYRAYATNSVGTSYGSDVIFTTNSSTPTITVTSPTSGTIWNVGSTAIINWTSSGSISNVNIKLSTDGGNSFSITLASSTLNDGTETITVPNNPSITCRLKVESSADPSIYGITSDNFPIYQQTGTDFWQQRSTPYNVTIYSLAINSGGSIYAGANNRIYSSSDDGVTWSLLNQSMTSYLIRTLYIPQDGQIFAGTGGDGIYLSTNNGSNWTQKNSGIGLSYINSFLSNSNGNILVGAYGLGIYRSMDSGDNWIQSNTGLTNNKINVLAISNSGNIFAGTDGGGMFRSTDAGNTWAATNYGLNNKSIYSVGITSTGNIFVGTDVGNIYRSTDNGDTWSLVNVGMTSSTIISLVINSNGYVYAGTWGSGVFVSKDNGNSWSQVNSGLTDKEVSSLVIDKNDYLIAGTKNGTVFKSIKTKESTCYTLLTNTNPNGSGNISINTSQNCSGGFSSNTQINLTASPSNGYSFSGWSVTSGGYFSNSSTTTTTFTITGNATVTANFTPVSNPIITTSVNSLPDFGNQQINTVSIAKHYMISGSSLTADLVITAPSGFEISTSQTTNFGSSLTLQPLNGEITSKTIWVRFVPTIAQTYSGYISNVCGTAFQNVNVSGTGTNICNPGWTPISYTNSTTAYGIVTINGTPATSGDKVGAFVSSECRGIGTVIVNQGNAYVTLNIQGDRVESVGFKIFHVSECKIYEVGYTTSTNPGNTIGNPPNYLPIASSQNVTQNINLATGWNYVSFYVHAQDMAPGNIFGSISSSLSQVKNLTQSYDPTVPVFLNTLTSLQDGYGYLVKLKNNASLSVVGSLVGSVSVPLSVGWNLIGHPKQNALPVTTVFSSIMSDISQIKSVDKSYDPSVPAFLNTLSQMEPGQGYFIKMKNNNTINYSLASQNKIAGENVFNSAVAGTKVVTYTNSTTVYGEITYDGIENIKYVEAMVNGECRARGEVVKSEGKYYVTLVVNGETEEPAEFNLYGDGDKFLGESPNRLITKPGEILNHLIVFNDKKNVNSKTVSELIANKLYPVYPNPFNPTTIITFELIESSPVDLTIYNINGALVRRILSQNLSSGHYSYEWDCRNDNGEKCSSGIYLLKMVTKQAISSQKLLLLK